MGNVRKYKHLSCFDLLELITDAQFEEAAGLKLKKKILVVFKRPQKAVTRPI